MLWRKWSTLSCGTTGKRATLSIYHGWSADTQPFPQTCCRVGLCVCSRLRNSFTRFPYWLRTTWRARYPMQRQLTNVWRAHHHPPNLNQPSTLRGLMSHSTQLSWSPSPSEQSLDDDHHQDILARTDCWYPNVELLLRDTLHSNNMDPYRQLLTSSIVWRNGWRPLKKPHLWEINWRRLNRRSSIWSLPSSENGELNSVVNSLKAEVDTQKKREQRIEDAEDTSQRWVHC